MTEAGGSVGYGAHDSRNGSAAFIGPPPPHPPPPTPHPPSQPQDSDSMTVTRLRESRLPKSRELTNFPLSCIGGATSFDHDTSRFPAWSSDQARKLQMMCIIDCFSPDVLVFAALPKANDLLTLSSFPFWSIWVCVSDFGGITQSRWAVPLFSSVSLYTNPRKGTLKDTPRFCQGTRLSPFLGPSREAELDHYDQFLPLLRELGYESQLESCKKDHPQYRPAHLDSFCDKDEARRQSNLKSAGLEDNC